MTWKNDQSNRELEDQGEQQEVTSSNNRLDNFNSLVLLQEISTKLSLIIEQNNEAFDQQQGGT